MYECLYGYTPFACDNRQDTKLRILKHRTTLKFPNLSKNSPPISFHALDFMISILQEKEDRLCSRRYKHNDFVHQMMYGFPQLTTKGQSGREARTHFVYPNDAEDIKDHHFFRNIPWDDLHKRKPPFVPRVRNWEDTKYFDSDDMISDMSDSSDDTPPMVKEAALAQQEHMPATNGDDIRMNGAGSRVSQHHQEDQKIIPSAGLEMLKVGEQYIQPLIPNPLRPKVHSQTTGASHGTTVVANCAYTENMIRYEKPKKRRKEKKRPRDKILRDAGCAKTALELRKRGAFLGYGYRRAKAASEIIAEVMAEMANDSNSSQRSVWHQRLADIDQSVHEAGDVPMVD